ncbi:MAG: TetR/AcrR family transcriptional regulator [Neisseria sp.]|nr:TetR/AcrR family transcriptional regulator [Neisseria sp.]
MVARPRKNKPNTYERIIDASLKLFNEEGERKISTNHISMHLVMSPGNLYYHFRNKDEIIMQLFKRYRHDILTFLEDSEAPQDAAGMRRFIADIFNIMWDYRFFFSDVNTLLSRSSELQDEHEKFTLDQISPLIASYLERMNKSGVLSMDETDTEFFTVNFWILIKYWFVFDKSIHNNHLDESSKRRGLRQILGLLRPYVGSAHRAGYDQELEQL